MQSYQHADPRRQQQDTAVAARVTSNSASVTGDGFRNRLTLTFDLWVNACRATTIEYMCTKFGVDSSSRFPFTARTDRQIDATERPTHAGGYTAGVGNNVFWLECSYHAITTATVHQVNSIDASSASVSPQTKSTVLVCKSADRLLVSSMVMVSVDSVHTHHHHLLL